ncbi:MAG: 5-histidylcysteine sulfoxide synthase [Candidatus Sericytochromatia bacterium]|nr:5-histidylcysteine sulfoxide synthase [Candidatus Sericytochromatia bacterium]
MGTGFAASHVENRDDAWRQNLSGQDDSWLRGARGDDWWTGKLPLSGQCPGVGPDGRITSLPQPDVSRCSREDLLDYFDNSWAITEILFAALQGEEAFFRPPYHDLRHPLVFYYGHPAALYLNKLRVAGLAKAPVNPYFETLLEAGVDEMSWDDMSKNAMQWPSVRDVQAYRRLVYETVRQVIASHPDLAEGHAPITRSSSAWAIVMGLEHERIHIETTTVLMRELPIELVRQPDGWPDVHASATAPSAGVFPPLAGRDYPENPLVAVAEGEASFGKPADWPSYGWDNEYGERQVRVRPFQASRQLISNGEYYAFIQAGGYSEQRYWTEEGWQWRSFRNTKWPTFWVPDGPAGLHHYRLRTIFAVVAMPWSWPADVNYHEAKAYCAWRTAQDGAGAPYRVLTEAEHHRLRAPEMTGRQVATGRDPVMTADGRALAARFGLNLNLAFGSEVPVDAFPANANGIHDAMGNVWQWCEDHFNPLQGFQADPFYDDFSLPCFDGKHQMILGGSFASTGDEASIWARFHFRPHFFQHAGFRLVRPDDANAPSDAVRLDGADSAANVYESQQALNEYLVLHFGEPGDQMPYAFGPHDATAFPVRCADLVRDAALAAGITSGRALDVGCAVGRSTFELARTFESVIGVDLSAGFIEAANTLQRNGQMPYFRKDEGDLGAALTATIDPAIDRSRLSFRQADACSLPPDFVGFDAVLMANLICRLPSPNSLLSRLGGPRGLVRPGGILVMTTPFSWLEQFSPREVWLGGYIANGEPVWSKDTLHAALADEFELVSAHDMPLVIREHARKYQYIVTYTTVWKRR